MKTQTTKRSTCRLAASIAIATAIATSGVWAANRYWTGADNTIWDNTGNWEGGNLPGNDEVYFQNDKFNSKFTGENESVIIFTNSFKVWRTRLRGAGSEQSPLVFRASDSSFGLNFGTNVGLIVADSQGSGYLRIESGTYPSGVGIRVGENATYNGLLTVTGGSVLKATNGNLDIQNGKVVLNNGSIEISKTDKYVSLGNQADGCALYLESEGVLTTSLIWDGNKGKSSTVLFNGGTLRANGVFSSNWPAIIADKQNISVKVGAKGGIIDSSGYNIQVARSIAPDGENDGGMMFKGGGSVTLKYANTYNGVTTLEVGTTLIVPSAIAGDKLAFTIPVGIANGVYKVVTLSGGDVFADSVLENATLPEDENAIFRLSGDKKSIVCLYGFEAEGDVYIGATDGDLSTAANWLSGTVPTSGAPTIFCGSAATLSVGATFAPNTVVIPASSAVITIGMGDLTVNTLTNACKLSIAQGASLTVIGDLVANTTSSFLYCNEGFVTVNGNVVAHSPTERSTMTEYSVVTANTNPIKTQGLAYLDGGEYLYFKLISNDNKDGFWVIGKNGLTFPGSRSRSNCRFYTQNASATLYSSDDWTLANSGRSNTTGGDFEVCSNSSLTIDTSDYDDPTNVSKAHTVTLKGRIKADGNLTIAGCGKVVFDEEGANPSLDEIYKHSSVASGKTIFVTDTATLKINAGKKITGNGTVSLAAGTTLALTAISKDFTPCIDPSLALPATGTATICIDGTRLRSGNHLIATVASGTADNVVLDLSGKALDGRRATFRVDENNNLILNIQSNGMMIVVR